MRSDISKIKEIFKGIVFTQNEIDLIAMSFQKIICKKGDVILNTNEAADYQYYTYKGCLRSYYTDALGKEHTVQFAVKDWWISDYTSYFSNSKSIMSIEVLQDAILYRICKKDKEYLYGKVSKVESFFRKKLEGAFAAFQKRILSNISQSATERYINFRNTYPEIESEVKNYHIASYLGITTESLSRIRKEIASK